MNKKIYETIADIAYTAGVHRYYSGDSRADMQTFINLAENFELLYDGIDWNDGVYLNEHNIPDYMEAIESFVKHNLTLIIPINFVPDAAKTQWDCIEVEAIYDDGEIATPIQHLDDGNLPVTYHSLYLHQVDGGVHCIADVPTEKDAIELRQLIETAVRTFTKNDNSDFVDLKPRLVELIDMLHRQHYHPEYKKALEQVKEFVNNHKLP